MFMRVQINGSYLETNATWKFADKEVNMGSFRDGPGRKAHGTEGLSQVRLSTLSEGYLLPKCTSW